MAKRKSATAKKPKLIKRIAMIAAKVLLWFVVFSVVWVLAYRFINPPITFLMVQRNWERKADGKPAKIIS